MTPDDTPEETYCVL